MFLSDTSVKRPVLATMMSLSIVLFGAIGYTKLSVREYPDIDPPIISVSTFLPGANPRVMESAVTDILEEELSTVEGLRTLTSTSGEQFSNITLEFNLNRPVESAAQDVRDKVSRVRGRLPREVLEPVIAKQDADAQPFYWLALSGENYSLLDLSDIGDRVVKQRLQCIPGVGNSAIYGERRISMRIWLSAKELAARDLTVQTVEAAIRSRNVEIPAGRIESDNREFTVRSLGELKTPQEFGDLVVANQGGQLVRLKDLARVELGPRDERSMLRFNGTSAVAVGIVRQSKANMVDVADSIRAALPQIEQALPPGVTLRTAFDQSVYVKRSISETIDTLFLAFVLVVIVIFLFLRNMRATLVPSLAIPVSIVGAFGAMFILGYSVNTFTLLALILAIGLVVDDAIIVLENAYRHQEELGEDPTTAAMAGTSEIGFAVIATTISLVAVFAPLAFLQGTTGRLFNEFGVALAGSVIISGFVALTLTPMLCARILRVPKSHGGVYKALERGLDWMATTYATTLAWAVRRQWVIIGGAVASLVLAYVTFKALKSEFIPAEDRGFFMAMTIAPQGATVQFTDSYQKQVEGVMAGVPEINSYFSIVGFGGDVSGGFVFVNMKDWRDRTKSTQEVIGGVMPGLFGIPGVMAFAFAPSPIGGFGSPVQFVVQHSDFDSLTAVMPAFLGRAMQIPGLVNVQSNLKVDKPELTVRYDRDRAEDLGVSVSDVGATLETMLGGRRVSTFTRDNKLYDVMVQMDPADRATPSDMSSLYVRGRDGQLINLAAVTTVDEGVGPQRLFHYNRVPSFTISANLMPGFTIGEALDSLNAAAAVLLPRGGSTALSGESREFAESGTALYLAFGLALLVVYMVLAAQFESLIHPFTVLLAVPLAVTGALVTLFLTGSTLNLYSQIGMILLIGLASKNSILLVEYANQLRDRGLGLVEATLEAGRVRLRPILMTAFATIFGALPIALGLSAGSESRQPLGYVIVGGMFVSTFLTLYLVPVVYVLFELLREKVGGSPRRGRAGVGGGGMMLSLLLALQVAQADTLPQVTLAEALREATTYDPNYVVAAGFVSDATWVRRAAMLVFVLPSITATVDFTGGTTPSFNFGTNSLSSTIVTARLDARYELFTGGRKISEYQRSTAELQGAVANEVGANFLAAAETEATFYDVVARRSLVEVALRRVERAESQLAISRSRVLSGAAVQTDSLQVLLELMRARVDLLREQAGLDVARAELGRRVGRSVAVDAAGADSAPAPALPISLEEAVQVALAQGPQIRVAEAQARATAADVRARKAAYLPWVTLTGSTAAYDNQFWPDAATRTSGSLTISLPIWNNGLREIALTQAQSANKVAIAIRDDLQRGALADVTRSYAAYETAAEAAIIAAEAVTVARENYRVQETRYRAGAVDIIEFLNGQVDLADAEAGLVQARYATKLALAGLEVILGRRLFPSESPQ